MLTSRISGREVLPVSELETVTAKTVCITGHREKYISPYQKNPLYRSMTVSAVKLMLYKYIDMAVADGYTGFISGLATGTDLWAAEYIIKKRRSNNDIHLFGVMPFLRHADGFSTEYKEILRNAELEADGLYTSCDSPEAVYGKKNGGNSLANLYRDRNYSMVDRSGAVIAFLNSESFSSGTAQTVNYARRCGRKVCRFSTDDIFRIMDEAGTDILSIGKHIVFLDDPFKMPW